MLNNNKTDQNIFYILLEIIRYVFYFYFICTIIKIQVNNYTIYVVTLHYPNAARLRAVRDGPQLDISRTAQTNDMQKFSFLGF